MSFYRGANEETYQFINLETDQLVIPSTLSLTEENRYVLIEEFKGYAIKYDGLGEEGFSIWKEDGSSVLRVDYDEAFNRQKHLWFWELSEAKSYIRCDLPYECPICSEMVHGQHSEVCYFCKDDFCINCVKWFDDLDSHVCQYCIAKHKL